MDILKKIGLTPADLDIQPTQDDLRKMHAFTPQEGRYAKNTDYLRDITSEYQSVKRRLELEIEYLIALGDEFQNYHGTRRKLIENPFGDTQREALRKLYQNFSPQDYVRFKRIEKETDHDVVAINTLALYNLGDVVDPNLMERAVHFGRTSSDMDSNVFSLMMHDILRKGYIPSIGGLQKMFIGKAKEWHKVPEGYHRPFTVIAAQTHEQYAVPTPLKKVVANIVSAIDEGISPLVVSGPKGDKPFRLYGKMGGAIGDDSAMIAAYPGHDWRAFYKKFIEGLGLEYQPVSDQDESNMKLLELLGIIRKTNIPLLKWCDDYSSYLSRNVLKKKTKKASSGSSIMPQKINPWRTEGGETFLYLADAELEIYELLGRQRKQGDLRRSVLKRYIGVPMGNIGIAIGRIREDLEKTIPNYEGIEKELSEHPELAAANVQTILRAAGVPDAYYMMLELTKGRTVTPKMMEGVIDRLVSENAIDGSVGEYVKKIFTPENNVGGCLGKF